MIYSSTQLLKGEFLENSDDKPLNISMIRPYLTSKTLIDGKQPKLQEGMEDESLSLKKTHSHWLTPPPPSLSQSFNPRKYAHASLYLFRFSPLSHYRNFQDIAPGSKNNRRRLHILPLCLLYRKE